MMCAHFPGFKPGRFNDLRCDICQDMKQGHCQGKNLTGEAVIVCMLEKATFSEFAVIGSASSMQ
jgi:hypothetical protein